MVGWSHRKCGSGWFINSGGLLDSLFTNSWILLQKYYVGLLKTGTVPSQVSAGPPAQWAIDLVFADGSQKQFTLLTSEFSIVADDTTVTNGP